jgi:hypothetical protein
MKKSYGFLLAAVGIAATSQVQAQNTVLADWTFETSAPVTAGPFAAESGLFAAGSAATGHHSSGSAVYSSPAGNGSAHSLSSTFWSVGDFYQVQVSTVGFSGIQLSLANSCFNGVPTGPSSLP